MFDGVMNAKLFAALAAGLLALNAAQASTFKTIYTFCTGEKCTDGVVPGSLMNGAGHLFGTTSYGGTIQQGGTIFELIPAGPEWQHNVLYDFCSQSSCTDGQFPNTELILDGPGNLLGTAMWGEAGHRLRFDNLGGGTVYSWSGTIGTLYDFCLERKCSDGAGPRGGLVRDADGNLYGSTGGGGDNHNVYGGAGTIFMIAP